jgi:F-type H+-transporting ATPase subunit a
MTVTFATLALVLTLGQPAPAEAQHAEHARPVEEAHGDHAAAAAEHGAPAGEHGEAAAEEHGAAKHDESLGAVMMHHVTDGYVIEHPGVCHGGFAWNCELDLDHVFGTVRDDHGHAVSGPFVFGGLDMTPSKHLVMIWTASIILLLVVLVGVRRRSLVPRGLYNFVETLVAFVRNEIAVKNIGERDADRFTPYLVSAFFFILFVNLFGLVPFAASATANLSVTVALALFTFVITQYAAIRAMGLGGYFAHLTGGVPKSLWPLWFIMIPVEFMGLFTKPFALTVRLFANMVAGHFVILALLGLIFALGTPLVALGSVPMALAIFMLELFVAFVQAYIFTMLSSLFIGAGLVHHGDHDEHGHAGHGGSDDGSHVAGAVPGHG